MRPLWILVYDVMLITFLRWSEAATVNPSDIEAPPRYQHPSLPGILCLKCSPGTFLKSHCEVNLTTSSCRECPAGQFSVNYNQAQSCETCRTKENGCPIRNAHLVITCNSTTNNFCLCNDGYYYHPKSQNPMTEYEGNCELHSPCVAGEGVKVGGTPNNNTKCEVCPEGMFSDVVSSTAVCRPYKNCSAGTFPKGGTKSTDVSCEPSGTAGNDHLVVIIVPTVIGIIVILVIIGVIYCVRKRRETGERESDKDPSKKDQGSTDSYILVPKVDPPEESVNSNNPPVVGNGLDTRTTRQDPPEEPVNSNNPPVVGNGLDTRTTGEEPRSKKVPWGDVCRFLSRELSGTTNYKMALRSIIDKSDYKGGEGLIVEHSNNYPRDVKEVIYNVLYDWTKKCRCTLDMVIDGLKEENLNRVITDLLEHDSVKKYLKENDHSTSC
ncbi:tumor necrosis factor receptor superfamily member 5-like isoform X2 [Argopecten irradians]|uniref:tumor necrosis factor receptor superfamily member 5-like isoform X2 n=1 Tax=Argopecten irradians TaxID=31199 RepID=UPI003723EE4E